MNTALQSAVDRLQDDLNFSTLQGGNYAIMTTQESVKEVLSELRRLQTATLDQEATNKTLVAEVNQLRERIRNIEP